MVDRERKKRENKRERREKKKKKEMAGPSMEKKKKQTHGFELLAHGGLRHVGRPAKIVQVQFTSLSQPPPRR